MICPQCGNANRPGARFCKRCGMVLEQVQPAPPPPVPAPASRPPSPPLAETVPSPPLQSWPVPPAPPPVVPSQPAAARAGESGGAGRVVGGIGLFAGLVLAIIGAVIALAAFFLPWFSTGGLLHTGVSTVSGGLEPGADMMLLVWGLVPLGALGLLLLSLVGVALGLFGRRLSAGLARLLTFLPLLVALSGLCGCFPLSSQAISALMAVNFDFNTFLSTLGGLQYGFWAALGGLGMSLLGALVGLIGALIARRRAA